MMTDGDWKRSQMSSDLFIVIPEILCFESLDNWPFNLIKSALTFSKALSLYPHISQNLPLGYPPALHMM
jgi:hypothetical protein